MADGTNTALPALPNPFAPVPVSCSGVVTAATLSPGAAVTSNSDPMHHPAFPPASETRDDASASSLFSSSGFVPVGESLVGWRENRFLEKLPAESTGASQAGYSRPFKATDSRTNFDPGMSGFGDSFAADIAILEAQWARDGMSMNATTFFTDAANSIPPASSSIS